MHEKVKRMTPDIETLSCRYKPIPVAARNLPINYYRAINSSIVNITNNYYQVEEEEEERWKSISINFPWKCTHTLYIKFT